MTNYLNFPFDNNEINISLGIWNNDEIKVRLASIYNNKEDIRPININKQKPITPH